MSQNVNCGAEENSVQNRPREGQGPLPFLLALGMTSPAWGMIIGGLATNHSWTSYGGLMLFGVMVVFYSVTARLVLASSY